VLFPRDEDAIASGREGWLASAESVAIVCGAAKLDDAERAPRCGTLRVKLPAVTTPVLQIRPAVAADAPFLVDLARQANYERHGFVVTHGGDVFVDMERACR
jgi:hypothetical protein